jgi:hypothetical protein
VPTSIFGGRNWPLGRKEVENFIPGVIDISSRL